MPAHYSLGRPGWGVFLSGGIDYAITSNYLDAPRTYSLGIDARGSFRARCRRVPSRPLAFIRRMTGR